MGLQFNLGGGGMYNYPYFLILKMFLFCFEKYKTFRSKLDGQDTNLPVLGLSSCLRAFKGA